MNCEVLPSRSIVAYVRWHGDPHLQRLVTEKGGGLSNIKGDFPMPDTATNTSVRMLTPTQKAAQLNITTHTLKRWRDRGVGPAYVKYGHRIVRYFELDEPTGSAA